MKRIKDITIGFILGIVVLGGLSVYAVEAVIDSKEVSYDNKESHGRSEDVQGSIDELYERSGIMQNKWVDPILNGADPVLGQDMIPVTIDDDGTVHYANLYTKWYQYETKKWANAVILVDSPSKSYKTGDTIADVDIESYFVWIPRYKYKIWDLGNYTSFYSLGDLKDSAETAESNLNALRHITGNERLIDIVFETKEVSPSKESSIGKYYTHPAFTLGEKQLNGIWVGKFEVTGNIDNITVKSGAQSVRNQTVGAFWKALYDYRKGQSNHNSNLDPHMMKNTEWGAVAYLSHSVYGIGTEVNINNNSDYKTGYSATPNTDQTKFPGIFGTTDDVTQPWNTSTGYLASTTGNITGIYDMSGGTYEYVASYVEDYGVKSTKEVSSGLTDNDLTNYAKYFDKYLASSNSTSYNLKIIGDATGEIGPFYLYFENKVSQIVHNGWYADDSYFVDSENPWFIRGGSYNDAVRAGQFNFSHSSGGTHSFLGSRLVLAI